MALTCFGVIRDRTPSGRFTLQCACDGVTPHLALQIPKVHSLTFETAIIERNPLREMSVEESLLEMYFAGVSLRRVEYIVEALRGTRVNHSTVSELNQNVARPIEAWHNQPIEGEHTYVS